MYVCDIKARAAELACVANNVLLSATMSERLSSYSKQERVGISRVLEINDHFATLQEQN